MANIVNGQSSGYDTLDTLKNVHKEILSEIAKELEDILNLLGDGNGFYAESTCEKITTLLESFEKDIIASVQDAFEASEDSVVSMENALTENDYL